MGKTFLLDPVQIIRGAHQPLIHDAALIKEGKIHSFGERARKNAKSLGLLAIEAHQQVIGPCLIDPHSILEEPFSGNSESINTLRSKAAKAGYGQIALMPRSHSWRDCPERLQGYKDDQSDVIVHLWGAFSKNGAGKELSTHADLLANGAIGLAEDDSIIPLELLKKGLVLGEMGESPMLLAPRDVAIQGKGMVREGVEALRAGWSIDPLASETLPLTQLLELHKQHPEVAMRIMNISTASGVEILEKSPSKPMASVCWWHLVKDSSLLSSTDLGWRVHPSLGGPNDRKALINALFKKTITAIAVHGISLDAEETKQPPETRQPGISGHHLVLPLLWQELVVKAGLKAEQLWELLSFGPSRMLSLKEEFLEEGSPRWVLFDPHQKWIQTYKTTDSQYSSNQPFEGEQIIGKVIECGLKDGEILLD